MLNSFLQIMLTFCVGFFLAARRAFISIVFASSIIGILGGVKQIIGSCPTKRAFSNRCSFKLFGNSFFKLSYSAFKFCVTLPEQAKSTLNRVYHNIFSIIKSWYNLVVVIISFIQQGTSIMAERGAVHKAASYSNPCWVRSCKSFARGFA